MDLSESQWSTVALLIVPIGMVLGIGAIFSWHIAASLILLGLFWALDVYLKKVIFNNENFTYFADLSLASFLFYCGRVVGLGNISEVKSFNLFVAGFFLGLIWASNLVLCGQFRDNSVRYFKWFSRREILGGLSLISLFAVVFIELIGLI